MIIRGTLLLASRAVRSNSNYLANFHRYSFDLTSNWSAINLQQSKPVSRRELSLWHSFCCVLWCRGVHVSILQRSWGSLPPMEFADHAKSAWEYHPTRPLGQFTPETSVYRWGSSKTEGTLLWYIIQSLFLGGSNYTQVFSSRCLWNQEYSSLSVTGNILAIISEIPAIISRTGISPHFVTVWVNENRSMQHHESQGRPAGSGTAGKQTVLPKENQTNFLEWVRYREARAMSYPSYNTSHACVALIKLQRI